MASIALALPRGSSSRARPVLSVAIPCAAAAAAYGWMRVPLGDAQFSAYRTMCSHVEMAPGDWPCAIGRSSIVLALVAGALLTGLALALPGLILAASGRRITALVPVALAAAATGIAASLSPGGFARERLFGVGESVLGSGDASGFWLDHAGLALVVDALLVSIPALAVIVVLRPPPRPRTDEIRRHASWVATFAVIGTIAIARMSWTRLPSEDFFVAVMPDTLIATGTMALFGALLGTDRRWWPWSLVPVAFFLSLGPSMALASLPTDLTALTWFGSALPLVVAGLLGSLWRPLAERLSGVRADVAVDPAAGTRRVRPTTLLNAGAVGLLIVAILAARYDPLPIQISTSVPTYLGQRQAANDVRALMNLDVAIGALEAYRLDAPTYVGFDAAIGEAHAGELRWLDRVTHNPLVVTVAEAGPSRAVVLAQSGSGRMYCAQTTGDAARYGYAEHRPPSAGGATLAERALASCGATAFIADAIRLFDVSAMCEGVQDQGILICRASQRLIRDILASPISR